MVEAITSFQALKMVRGHFQSDQAMASAFHVSQPTVWRWLNHSNQLPAEHVLRAEMLTSVPRHLLRPDIYPADLGPSPAWKGVDQGTQRVSFNQNSALQERAA